jgi:hypothetical protein
MAGARLSGMNEGVSQAIKEAQMQPILQGEGGH